jgi:hypothetical protein
MLRGSRSAHVEELGMEYLSIPWRCRFPSNSGFAKFLKVTKPTWGRRSLSTADSAMTARHDRLLPYATEQGWSVDEAMKEMKLFGS